MKNLNDKVAMVTGASLGIGAAIAKELAAQGCRVALVARTQATLEQVAAEIEAAGGTARPYPCDMNDADAVATTVTNIAADLGPIAILVNNAGAGTFKPLNDMTTREAMLTVNLPFGAAVAATHAVVPGMIERGEGHIVNLTSPAGYFPLPYMVPYTASRHAMVGLSRSLREELEPHGIGVSLICPAQVNTGYFERNDADLAWYPRLQKAFPALEPEQVARETVRAIRANKAEHVFGPLLAATTFAYQHAPRTGLWLFKKLGLFQPLKKR
jgi:short-subunit dehydrogenase